MKYFNVKMLASISRKNSDYSDTYYLAQDLREILRFSFLSSICLTALLVCSDAVALIPVVPGFKILLIRILGLWFSAILLWSFGFCLILNLIRLLSGNITIDKNGIKLSHFHRFIKWDDICFVELVKKPHFSRIFFTNSRMLVLGLKAKEDKKTIKIISLPSFTFKEDEFNSFFAHICQNSFHILPSSTEVLAFKSSEILPKLAKLSTKKLKAIAFTVFIIFSLVIFIGKKTMVNYAFNEGTQIAKDGNSLNAIPYYAFAANLEPSFAPAWDRLARCQFRCGDFAAASENWKMSLIMKPDFVESKLGLSTICLIKGDYAQAKKLIDSASRLAPQDEAVLLNRAYFLASIGQNNQAISLLRESMFSERSQEKAVCLQARCYLNKNDFVKAASLLQDFFNAHKTLHEKSSFDLLFAEIFMKEGDLIKAELYLRKLGPASDCFPEAIYALAILKIEQGRKDEAKHLFLRLKRLNPFDERLKLLATRCEGK